MTGYTTEEEQVELLKSWWSENGKSAIFGIILGLGAIFGWRGWQANILEKTGAASEVYQKALAALNEGRAQDARDGANQVVAEYNDTGYAVFARLLLAQMASEDEKYSEAGEQLNAALSAADNPSMQHEITLRLARVLIADKKPDQALTLLNKTDYGAFASGYNELKGDAYAQQNKIAEARQAYQQAITEAQGAAGGAAADVSILNLKLEVLGPESN